MKRKFLFFLFWLFGENLYYLFFVLVVVVVWWSCRKVGRDVISSENTLCFSLIFKSRCSSFSEMKRTTYFPEEFTLLAKGSLSLSLLPPIDYSWIKTVRDYNDIVLMRLIHLDLNAIFFVLYRGPAKQWSALFFDRSDMTIEQHKQRMKPSFWQFFSIVWKERERKGGSSSRRNRMMILIRSEMQLLLTIIYCQIFQFFVSLCMSTMVLRSRIWKREDGDNLDDDDDDEEKGKDILCKYEMLAYVMHLRTDVLLVLIRQVIYRIALLLSNNCRLGLSTNLIKLPLSPDQCVIHWSRK